MKLLMMIFLLLVMILLFLHLCKKMGIDVNKFLTQFFDSLAPSQPQNQPQNPVAARQALYQLYELDYQNFGNCVWACLVSIKTKCHLNCTGKASTIYCADIVNRVKPYGNKFTFTYEMEVNCRSYIQNGKLTSEKIDTDMIAEAIRANFPVYLKGGYTCTGNIYVWDNGDNTVSIEFNGVDRNASINTGDIII